MVVQLDHGKTRLLMLAHLSEGGQFYSVPYLLPSHQTSLSLSQVRAQLYSWKQTEPSETKDASE